MTLGDQAALMGIAPRVNEGADVRLLRLDSHEGFLLSQIDGTTPAGILADLVAMEPEILMTLLRRLEKLGVVTWAGEAEEKPKQVGLAAKPAAAPTLQVCAEPSPREVAEARDQMDPALAESCDLTRDERLQILAAERDIETKTYWERLQLAGTTVSNLSTADIKRAYFVQSKVFHPDRYFGREIGSFAARLEKIFHALRTAYAVLRNPDKRKEYAAEHPPPARLEADPAPEAKATKEGHEGNEEHEETVAEKRARLEARRQEILEGRRQKRWNEHFGDRAEKKKAKIERAREMYDTGLAQLRIGKVMAAAASFKLAVTWDPNNSQYQSMFEEANPRAVVERAKIVADQAEVNAAAGLAGSAAAGFARAFEMAPAKAEYAVRAAEEFLQAGEIDKALSYATQAIEVSPQRIDGHISAATACEQAGSLKNAIDYWEAARRLDNNDARAKKALKRLRKRSSNM